MMRYQSVLQHSEEDCGAACLATVSKHYGRNFAISRVREAVGTGSRGTTLLGLFRGAEVLGFNLRQVKASSQLLDRIVKAYHSSHSAIVACEYAGTLGVPALFSRTLFAELMRLDFTKGAKYAIEQHIHEVYRIPFPEGAIDIDTPKEYEQLSNQRS